MSSAWNGCIPDHEHDQISDGARSGGALRRRLQARHLDTKRMANARASLVRGASGFGRDSACEVAEGNGGRGLAALSTCKSLKHQCFGVRQRKVTPIVT